MPYSPTAVANYFINRAAFEGKPADHLQLQKLANIAHGWNLAIRDQPLLDEHIEAWRFGPVIPSLYQQLKVYGNAPITQPVMEITGLGFSFPEVPSRDQETRSLLDRVWKAYRRYSGVQLSNLTHEAGTPWSITWQRSGGSGNAPIPDDLIKQHYRKLAGMEDGG